MDKFIIRRSGQLVGTGTNKDQVFSETLPGDKVFRVVETRGDFGCITEYIVKEGAK